jgi:hypothetical protein
MVPHGHRIKNLQGLGRRRRPRRNVQLFEDMLKMLLDGPTALSTDSGCSLLAFQEVADVFFAMARMAAD